MRFKVEKMFGGYSDRPTWAVMDVSDNDRIVGEYGCPKEAEAAALLREEKTVRLEQKWREEQKQWMEEQKRYQAAAYRAYHPDYPEEQDFL